MAVLSAAFTYLQQQVGAAAEAVTSVLITARLTSDSGIDYVAVSVWTALLALILLLILTGIYKLELQTDFCTLFQYSFENAVVKLC